MPINLSLCSRRQSQDMDFRIGIVIGASLWLVTEQQHLDNQICTSLSDIAEPCGCMISPETFEVICGSDGHTYLSMCLLNCRVTLENIKIEAAHKGPCSPEPRCCCAQGYDPVCGSDNITYSTECVFNCFKRDDESLRLKYHRECDSGEGYVNILYPDESLEEENQNKKLRLGSKTEASKKPPPAKLRAQPRQPPSCPLDNPPSIRARTKEECPNQPRACPLTESEKEARKKNCLCATLHRPVCSNHNETFANFCVLYCVSLRNPCFEFQYWGSCGKKQKTPYN